jgi:hypothetical protein
MVLVMVPPSVAGGVATGRSAFDPVSGAPGIGAGQWVALSPALTGQDAGDRCNGVSYREQRVNPCRSEAFEPRLGQVPFVGFGLQCSAWL